MTQNDKTDKLKIKKCKNEYIKCGYSLADQKKLIKYIVDHSLLSQRRIGKLIGQEASGYIANVISGKKRITNVQAVKLAEACAMNQREKIVFYEGVLNKL